MKIVISASAPMLDAPVDPRFGRCSYYLFVDTDTGRFEVQENTAALSGGGAGIQAAQTIVNAGAAAVVTGNVGPNAYQVLNAANIPIYLVAGVSIREAVNAYKMGQLPQASDATNSAHSGMTPPPAPTSPPSEIDALRAEVGELREVMAKLLTKIDEIAK
ncbi:MAG: NifB/NifX family molybdenum-iron cluster-binding protein [Anaerolineae bacterium]|nr:NifB/NifX family molybdenum-iron cluster-binding protein [Anaerolineae bacterium]